MKILFSITFLCFLANCHNNLKNQPVQKQSSLQIVKNSSKQKERKLLSDEEADYDSGDQLVTQLNDSQEILNTLGSQSDLSKNIEEVGGFFDNISEKVDKFRDDLGRKLNELKMSLQRPKIPMIGASPGVMNHPFHNNVWGVKIPGLGSDYEQELKALQQSHKSQSQIQSPKNDEEDERRKKI